MTAPPTATILRDWALQAEWAAPLLWWLPWAGGGIIGLVWLAVVIEAEWRKRKDGR